MYINKFFCFMVFVAMFGCGEATDNNVDQKNVALENNVIKSDEPDIKVVKWGPKQTNEGIVFNKQPNGESAIWFQMEGLIKKGTKLELWFGENKIGDVSLNSELGGSSLVPTSMISSIGDLPVYLVYAPTKRKYEIGIFKVISGINN